MDQGVVDSVYDSIGQMGSELKMRIADLEQQLSSNQATRDKLLRGIHIRELELGQICVKL